MSSDEIDEDMDSTGQGEECGEDEVCKMKELIKIVSGYPIVYDHNHPEYQHLGKRNQTWEIIAKQSKFRDVSKVKKKWKYLRSYYIAVMKAQVGTSQNCPNKKTAWTYADEMKFMEKIVETPESPKKRAFHSTPHHSSSDSEQSDSNRIFKRHLKSVEDTNRMIMDYLQKKTNEPEKERDSLSSFFRAMEDTVRKLSEPRQLEVKMRLSEVIISAEVAEVRERLGVPDANPHPMHFNASGCPPNMYLHSASNYNNTLQKLNAYASFANQRYTSAQNYNFNTRPPGDPQAQRLNGNETNVKKRPK